MSTDFPPIQICLEEAIADLNKLGRNLQAKLDSLKRKRFAPEKLRGRYGFTNITRKLFTICDLSRKSIENVEKKVRKSIKTYDNDRRYDPESPRNDLTSARVGLPNGVTLDHYSSCVVQIIGKEKHVVDEYINVSSDDSSAEKPPKKKKKVAFSDKLTYIDDLSDGGTQDSVNSGRSNRDTNEKLKSDQSSTKSKYKENYARPEKSESANGIDEADDSSSEPVETGNLNNENVKETSEKSLNTSKVDESKPVKTEPKIFLKCVDISKLLGSPMRNFIESEVIVLDTPSPTPTLPKLNKQSSEDRKVKDELLEDSDLSSGEMKKKRTYERVRRKLEPETKSKRTVRSDDSSHKRSGHSRRRDDRQKYHRHSRRDSSDDDKPKSDDAVKCTKYAENPAKKLRLNKDDSAKLKSDESTKLAQRTPPSRNRRKFVIDSDDSVKSNSHDATKKNEQKSKKPQSDNEDKVILKSDDERTQSDTIDSRKLKPNNVAKSTSSKNNLPRRKSLSDSDNLKPNLNEAAKDNNQTQSDANDSGKTTKTDAATKEDEVLVEQESVPSKNGLKHKRGKSSDNNDNVKSTANETATDDDRTSDPEGSGKSKSNEATNEDELLVPQKSTLSKKHQLTRRSGSEDSVKSNSNVAAEDEERTQSDAEDSAEPNSNLDVEDDDQTQFAADDSAKSNINEAAEDDEQPKSNCKTAEDAEGTKSDDSAISKSNHAAKEDELLVERKSTPSKKSLQLMRRESLSDSEGSAKSNVDAENDERLQSDDATNEDKLLVERKLTPSKKGLQLIRRKLSDSDNSDETNSNEVAKDDEQTQSDVDVSVEPKSDNAPKEDDLLNVQKLTPTKKDLLSGSADDGKSKRTHSSPKTNHQSSRRKLLLGSDDNAISDDDAKEVDLQIDLPNLQLEKVKKEILSKTRVASVQITPYSSLRTVMKENKLSRITNRGRTVMKHSVSADASAKQSLLVVSSTESERSSENGSADDSDSDIMKELSQTRRKLLKKRSKITDNPADTDSDIDKDQKQPKSDLSPDEQSDEMGRSQRIKTRNLNSNNEKSDSSAGSRGKDSEINRLANLKDLNKKNRTKGSDSSDSGPDKAKKRKTNNLPREVEENGVDDVELEEDEPSSDECMVEESLELAKESVENKTAANGATDAAELAKKELLDSNDTDEEQTEEKKKKTKSEKEPEDSSSSDTKSSSVKKSKGRPVDKLLTGRLSEDSASDDKKATDESSDNMRKKKKKSKAVIGSDSDDDNEKKKKRDSDSQSSSKSEDESKRSTGSGSEDDFKPNRRRAKKKTKNSSDESSDESKKGKKKRSRIKKRAEDSDESDGDSDSGEDGGKKGRKNIRRVLGKGDLEASTVRAEREEKLRRQRIADRQKLYNSVMFDESGKPEDAVVDKVVLDFDPDTKEPIIEVDKGIVKKLKPHQANGIKFMWDACFESVKQIEKRKGSGCILAHCMGLGKTLQVIALIHTLLRYSELTKTSRVLVVCPLSTVLNWVNEFKLWTKFAKRKDDIQIYEISRYKQNYERAHQLQEWLEEGGVCVLGYEMFRNLSADNSKKFRKKLLKSFQESLVDPGPDLVVCDEGHLLKNEKTSLSQSMNRIKTRRRIVLTGTPLQNNLKEYYCMVQFVKPNLLGKYNEYLNRFVNPITNGQYTDSTDHDIRIMKRRSHVLHKLLDGAVQRRDYGVLAPFLPPKHEYVIFITVTEIQAILYQYYLDNYSRRPHPDRKNSGFLFPDFQALQRIWTHPLVMKANSARYELMQQKKRDKEEEEESEGSLADFIDDESDAETTEEESSSSSSDSQSDGSDNSKKKIKKEKKSSKNVTTKSRSTRLNPVQKDSEGAVKEEDDVVEVEVKAENPTEWWKTLVDDLDLEDISLSNKLVLLFDILKQCEAIGDKVLVFSQSLYSLDLIEHFLSKIDEATQKDSINEKLCGHTGSWSQGLDYFRLDGQTSCENRSIWCKSFNKETNPRARLFLISTRAGGLGINLVAANRVIIFDVSWNPSHDVQSIFRIYRFGQKKPCYVYRFLAMGTMEEKIYERQVTKQAISKRVIDEQQIDRHYAENDLAELYIFTPEPLEPRPVPSLPKDRLFAEMIKTYEKLIYKYHEHDSLLENKEEETLTEEERKAAWDDFENEKNKPPPVANFPNMMMPMMNMNMGQDGLGNTGQMSLLVNHMMGLIRKENPTLNEQQLSAMIPALFSKVNQMADQSQPWPGYDYAVAQKMNPMYYQQNQHIAPNMMPGLSGVHGMPGAMPGMGGYPWQQQQQQQQMVNMQRLQQQQQQAAMGMKFYAGGLGSRDPVSMAEAQIRNREMVGASELPRRGRPPVTARPIITSADVVDVEDSE